MTLAEVCIRRPVLSIVLSVAIVLIGVMAFFALKLLNCAKLFFTKSSRKNNWKSY